MCLCVSVCWHSGTKGALYMQHRGKSAHKNTGTVILWSVVICTSLFPRSYDEQQGKGGGCREDVIQMNVLIQSFIQLIF